MIKSNRKFGLEIEFATSTTKKMVDISRQIHVIRDGSLDELAHAAEYVSEPMVGKAGEEEVRRVCEILKKGGATCKDPQTSIHIHLDGMKQGGTLRSSRTLPDTKHKVYGFSNKVRGEIGMAAINAVATLGVNYLIDRGFRYCLNEIDGVIYVSKADIIRKPRLNYTYYYIDASSRAKWLKNSFYFYTLFSDVMEGLVSNSRRYGNMYCIPLASSYDLDAIAGCKTERELKNVWYKGNVGNGHYHNSRYHNVNLHCYWDRHGTLEIRSHGGTIDPNKILLWLRMHQQIVDKLEDIEFDELKSMKGTPEEFIAFLDDKLVGEYTKRLLGYYSN